MKIKHLIVGELETNCYLLVSKDELGIIDPGGEAEKILKEIEKVKAKPSRGLGLASPKKNFVQVLLLGRAKIYY